MRQLFVVGAMVCLFGAWLAAQGQLGTIRVQVNAEGKAVVKADVSVSVDCVTTVILTLGCAFS